MSRAYKNRMIAFNAETLTRTATLQAMKQGQHAAWMQAAERGDVDAGQLYKQWQTVGDDKVRPSHVAMQGEIALATDPYSNGDVIPGESEFNCRCLSVYFTSKHDPRAA
jgi:uncharacterized protein with gpF-like domain